MARVELQRWPGHPDGFTRAERLGGSYELYFPDPLVGREFDLSDEVLAALEDAAGDLGRLDATAAVLTNSEALARLLLRAEAVGSSQIEGLVVGARRLLKAEALRERQRDVTAEEVLGAVDAMTWVTESVQAGDKLEVEHVLEAHRRLMAHSPAPEFGGEIRYLQNWIGGRSPAEAYYVPPPAQLVPELLADLMTFVRESSLPVLAKTAIAHAQFETIHPFADGNGRTGRALVHSMLRAKALTRNVTVPVSAGLLTDTEASFSAIANGRQLVADLRDTRERWSAAITARQDAVAWRLADLLLRQPVVDAELVQNELGATSANAHRALRQLSDAGILTEFSGRQRNRMWQSREVLSALDDFAARAGRRRLAHR